MTRKANATAGKSDHLMFWFRSVLITSGSTCGQNHRLDHFLGIALTNVGTKIWNTLTRPSKPVMIRMSGYEGG
ncbi:MAG: hypothetical protein NTV01_11400 [Bacteroidia bacterium]|nr:hypothetical protein [Bacteroidia bacterium]